MLKPVPDKNLIQIQNTDFFSHYMLQNKTGTGHLLTYNVLPGLQVFYSNFHLKEFTFNFENQGKNLIVLHCHNGSAEWLNSESMPKSMEENGLVLLDNMPASKTFKFPVHCYHGIAVVFSMDRCQCELMNMFKAVGVDFAALIEKIQPLTLPLKLPSSEHVSHIFSELYRLPKNIRLPYFKIKVLELILFLSRLDSEAKYETAAQIPSAYKGKMELLREILRENVEEHLTLEQLSKQIEMSPTQMKKYFKLAYGDTIYSYLKSYRMKKATQLLMEGKFNIAEIASRVGYTNSSKFAQAFKEYTGSTPKEYRNKA